MRRQIMKRTIVTFLGLIVMAQALCGESISIVSVPAKLPEGLALGAWSPPVCFSYSGLQAGHIYTFRAWLLGAVGSSYPLGSTQWGPKTFTWTAKAEAILEKVRRARAVLNNVPSI